MHKEVEDYIKLQRRLDPFRITLTTYRKHIFGGTYKDSRSEAFQRRQDYAVDMNVGWIP